GFRPRFSPDGNWIAYSVATEGARLPNMGYHAFVVPANGGAPRLIAADLFSASYPVWSPDSRSLILSARHATTRAMDWWVVAVDGGPSRNTEMFEGMRRRKQQALVPIPDAWTHDGQWIIFSIGTGDNSNLYRVHIPRAGKIVEQPEKITFGTAMETK